MNRRRVSLCLFTRIKNKFKIFQPNHVYTLLTKVWEMVSQHWIRYNLVVSEKRFGFVIGSSTMGQPTYYGDKKHVFQLFLLRCKVRRMPRNTRIYVRNVNIIQDIMIMASGLWDSSVNPMNQHLNFEILAKQSKLLIR